MLTLIVFVGTPHIPALCPEMFSRWWTVLVLGGPCLELTTNTQDKQTKMKVSIILSCIFMALIVEDGQARPRKLNIVYSKPFTTKKSKQFTKIGILIFFSIQLLFKSLKATF